MKPYEDFEVKIKELDGIVNKAIQNIDGQVKGFEEQKKAEKLEQIKEYYSKLPMCEAYQIAKFEMIFDEKWLNASVSMKTVCAEIDARIEQIAKDLETLSNLPEFSFEAIEEYKQSLDINKAIVEGQRLSEIQKRKAEEQQKMNDALEKVATAAETAAEGIAKVVEATNDAPRVWLSFKAHVTVDDANELRKFFNSRNIEFEAV